MTPTRIQLSRKKGWRLPPDTVVVSRPSKWGNPFVVQNATSRADAVAAFRARWLAALEAAPGIDNFAALRGKNLACWCPLDQPCHADVLLELANR